MIDRTPLRAGLEDAGERRDDAAIAALVDGLIELLAAGQAGEADAMEALAVLQAARCFTAAVRLAEAATALCAESSPGLTTRYAQALVEIGALSAADLMLARITDMANDEERQHILGLRGRIAKQRYIHLGRAEHLEQALTRYALAYDVGGGTNRLWPGVNLLALLKRAERDGASAPGEYPDVRELARALRDVATGRPPSLRTVWERASEIEIALALDRPDEAARLTDSLVGAPDASAFELTSLHRQLTEVWGLGPTHPVVQGLGARLLETGDGADLPVPSGAILERVFGAELPVRFETYARGMGAAQSVCKIADAAGTAWGTGFLVAGDLLDHRLGPDTVLVTNAHVVSSRANQGGLMPREAVARFHAFADAHGQPVELRGLRQVWTSDAVDCDATLLVPEHRPPPLPQALSVAPELPRVTDGAFVYVIGHPSGGDLALSIRGNELLAVDDLRAHYRAPTEPGSSGSPVFDHKWELMAVHHAGGRRVRRLDNPTKTYAVNEGITIGALRAALHHSEL